MKAPIVTLRRLWLAVPFTILAWSATRPFSDNSFLWHVRAGTLQLDRTEVLRTDPFSFTRNGRPWRTQSWLADIGYGWLERVTGTIDWAPLLVFIAMAAMLALTSVALWRAGAGTGAAVGVLLLLAWLVHAFSFPRPALLAFPLLALLVVALDAKRPAFWIIPGLVWLWASLHGSFAVGVGYVALDAVARNRVRRAAPAISLSLVAASVSAHGVAIWDILYRFTTNREALRFIEEWQPPSPTDIRAVPFFVLVALAALAFVSRRSAWRQLVVAVPFAVFGMLAARNMVAAAVVLAPFAGVGIQAMLQWVRRIPAGQPVGTSRREVPLMNAMVAVALALIAGVGLTRPVDLDDAVFPPREARLALEDGNVFHGTGVGGWLIYTEWPARLVYIDDRAELYGPQGFQELIAIQQATDWEIAFARHGIRQAIVERSWPLESALDSAGWIVRYEDEHFVVYAAQ